MRRKYTVEQLALTVRGRDAVVYKMHGDIEQADKAAGTRDDYERYVTTHAPFITALTGDLVERTFLFLGFSFTDPNLDYVLARICSSRFEQERAAAFLHRQARSKLPDEFEARFAYAKTRQELVAQDLLRFNIKTIAVNEFSDITELLRTLSNRFRQRTVFISGSAADYTPWGSSKPSNFLMRLAGADRPGLPHHERFRPRHRQRGRHRRGRRRYSGNQRASTVICCCAPSRRAFKIRQSENGSSTAIGRD